MIRMETKSIVYDSCLHDAKGNIGGILQTPWSALQWYRLNMARHCPDRSTIEYYSNSKDKQIRLRVLMNRNTPKSVLLEMQRNDPSSNIRNIAQKVLLRRNI